jgi:hypothetical protein
MERRKRIEQALAETIELLEREERYSPDLRKHDRVAFYLKHIQKLKTMLETEEA